MNRVFFMMLLVLLSCSLLFAGGEGESLEGESLSILTFTGEFNDQGIVQDFMDRTGIEVDLQIIPIENYEAKIRPLLATGQEVPDIFVGEAAYVRQFVEAGYWESLSKAPYNADVSGMYEYAAEMGTNKDGDVVALTWQTTPGGWFYRRSIAQDLFGSDDPAEVGKLFADWDAVLDTAQTLQDAGYTMFSGIGETLFRIFYSNRTEPWVNDNNEFFIDQQIKDYILMAKTIRDAGFDAKLSDWSGPFFEAMNTTPADAEVFVYGWPTWGLQFVLSGQENSSGDWAVTSGPGPFFWGGTWLGIYKDSPNKRAAWEFIHMLTQDESYMAEYTRRSEDFLSNKKVMAEVIDDFSSSTLGGQNHFAYFADQAEDIDGSAIQGYDYQINQILLQVMNEYLDGALGYDEALAALTSRTLEAFPRLTAR